MYVSPKDGTVFNAGPDFITGYLNPTTGAWTGGPISKGGYRNEGTSVMYDTGKILIVGGSAPTNSAERINLNDTFPLWQSAGSMAQGRRHVNSTSCRTAPCSSRVGPASAATTRPARFSNRSYETRQRPYRTPLARMRILRLYHSTATLLPDGASAFHRRRFRRWRN